MIVVFDVECNWVLLVGECKEIVFGVSYFVVLVIVNLSWCNVYQVVIIGDYMFYCVQKFKLCML